ncbi:hypothetical protein [Spirochaeta lutea]|uniref:hypothetical protein n=1 Tax=Spirochaeta lutea TaxID=1480694 RepID=UPI00068EF05C|nr:hypothetical protein [Spirochaeta lutea]
MEGLQELKQLHASSLSVAQMMRPRFSGGKIALPVQNYSVYAQFKHIEAVPAPAGSPGYSISKARMLDTLIDRLAQIKQRNNQADDLGVERSSGLSDEALDAMIADYAQQLQNTLQSGLPKLQQQFGTAFAQSGTGFSTGMINLVA